MKLEVAVLVKTFPVFYIEPLITVLVRTGGSPEPHGSGRSSHPVIPGFILIFSHLPEVFSTLATTRVDINNGLLTEPQNRNSHNIQ
jgi:uncharacterized membrane protein YadS